MDDQRSFPGKLLLFGEYAVIHGSQALAIPLRRFQAVWKMGIEPTCFVDWKELMHYVNNLAQEHHLEVDFSLWEKDVQAGICLESTIKPGYGAGSSGSLVAAIYDRYFLRKAEALVELRRDLGLLESYFHGASSGLDPLVSYLDEGIFIRGKEDFETVKTQTQFENLQVVLVDTQIARETSPLVQLYLKKFEEDSFAQCVESLKTLNQDGIKYYLSGDEVSLFKVLQQLSSLQLNYFKEMIPPDILPLWKELQGSQDHVIKLCGAGGGGYFLLFTKDLESLKSMHKHEMVIL